MRKGENVKTLIKRRLNGLCVQFERHTGRFCVHATICTPILEAGNVKNMGWSDKRGDNRSDDEKRNVLRGVTRGVTLLTFNRGDFGVFNAEKRVFLWQKCVIRGGLFHFLRGYFGLIKVCRCLVCRGFAYICSVK